MYGRQPAALIALQEKSRQELQFMLNCMFANADDAIFELAGQATTNAQQNLYFESMREIRLRRRGIEAGFFQAINENFRLLYSNKAGQVDSIDSIQADKLSLIDDEHLEEAIALDRMVNKVLNRHTPVLVQLTRFIAGQLERNKLSMKANPLGPLLLCRSFLSTCNDLQIDKQARLIFVRLFDKHIVDELGSFYTACNRVFYDHGAHQAALKEDQEHSEEDVDLPENRSEQPASLPQSGLVCPDDDIPSALSGEAPAVTRTQIVELLTTIQRSQAKTKENPLAAASPGIQDIHALLESFLQEKKPGQHQAIPMQVEERINIIGLLFDAIVEDPQIPDGIKMQLGRLQVPMVKAVLLEADFFENPFHPARRLLNELASAGIGWDPESNSVHDDYLQQVTRTVNRVLGEFNTDVGVFDEILAEFLSYIDVSRKRAALIEQRTISAEEGRAKAEQARAIVQGYLQEKTAGISMPEGVSRLLADGWGNVLFLIYVKDGLESSNWRNAIRTVDHLIWSVRPLTTEADKTRLLKLAPALLKNLHNGLRRLNYDVARIQAFLAELETVHRENIRCFDKKQQLQMQQLQMRTVSKPVAPQIPVVINRSFSAGSAAFSHETKSRLHEQRPLDETSSRKLPDEIRTASVIPAGAGTGIGIGIGIDKGNKGLADKPVRKIEGIKVGVWVEMTDEPGNTFRCRLASVIESAQRYIFVNRTGAKVAEKSLEQLTAGLSSGRIKILEDAHLFDRALESVIGNLRDIKDKAAS